MVVTLGASRSATPNDGQPGRQAVILKVEIQPTVQPDAVATVTAHLATVAGTPISALLTLSVDGHHAYELHTDRHGTFIHTVAESLSPGQHAVKVIFPGSVTLSPAIAISKLVLPLASPTIPTAEAQSFKSAGAGNTFQNTTAAHVEQAVAAKLPATPVMTKDAYLNWPNVLLSVSTSLLLVTLAVVGCLGLRRNRHVQHPARPAAQNPPLWLKAKRLLRPMLPVGRLSVVIFNHLYSVKWALALAALSVLGATLTDLLGPWPIKIIFDYVLLGQAMPSYLAFLTRLSAGSREVQLLILAGMIALFALLNGLFAYLQTYLTSRIGFQLITTLRRELFAQLQRLPLSFHQQSRRGELLTKVSGDTQLMKDVFTDSGLEMITNVLTLIGMFGIMVWVNWRLSLVPILTLPILLWLILRQQTKLRTSMVSQRNKEGKIASQLTENLSIMPVIKAFGRELYEMKRFEKQNNQNLFEGIQIARMSAAMSRTANSLSTIGLSAVVFLGAWSALHGQITAGDVFLFVTYVKGMYKPIRELVKLSTKCTQAMVSARRIGEILSIEPEAPDHPNAIQATQLQGDIHFEHVSFGYTDSSERILRNMSFKVTAGQRVALVGASGAGKSTIVNLILRLYDPQMGCIRIDGTDIRHYMRASLRQQIGIVLQDSILFGASIRENIAYGKPDATQAQVELAAQQAHIHDFIKTLPSGYDTVIGEMGSTLSGGQRQRIAIARALVKNPSILILDEPTSALDAESTALVQATIRQLQHNKTIIVITHQLNTIQDFDQIFVLNQGMVAEQGVHSELLTRHGLYAHLCRQQEGQTAPSTPSDAQATNAPLVLAERKTSQQRTLTLNLAYGR